MKTKKPMRKHSIMVRMTDDEFRKFVKKKNKEGIVDMSRAVIEAVKQWVKK